MSQTRAPTKADRYGISPDIDRIAERLKKMLLEYPFSKERFRFEAIKMALYTPRLLSRGALHYGWMSAVPLKHHSPEKRKLINSKIAEIEKSSLSPYEKVGKITDAIKKELGLKFISDSTFKEMMNTKFLEYTLRQEMKTKTFSSLQEALEALDQHSEVGRPTTLLAAHPEIFDLTKPANKRSATYGSLSKDSKLKVSPNKELNEGIRLALLYQQAHQCFIEVNSASPDTYQQLNWWQIDRIKTLTAELRKANPSLAWPESPEKTLVADDDSEEIWLTNSPTGISSRKSPRPLLDYMKATLELFEKEILEGIKNSYCHTPDPLSANLIATMAISKKKRWPLLHLVDAILEIDTELPIQQWKEECAKHIKGAQQTPIVNDGQNLKGIKDVLQTTRQRIEKFIGPVNWENDSFSYLGGGNTQLTGASNLQGLMAFKPHHKPTNNTATATSLWKKMGESQLSPSSGLVGYVSSESQIRINHKRNLREKTLLEIETREPSEQEWKAMTAQQAIQKHLQLFWARRNIGSPKIWEENLRQIEKLLQEDPNLINSKDDVGNSIMQSALMPPGRKVLSIQNDPDNKLLEMLKHHKIDLQKTNYYGETMLDSIYCMTPEDIERDETYNHIVQYAQMLGASQSIENAFMDSFAEE